MTNTVDVQNLWTTTDYCDLVVACEDAEWNCHKCIVLPRSKTLREAYESGTTVSVEGGHPVAHFDKCHPEALELVLLSFYHNDMDEMLGMSTPEHVAGAFAMAKKDGLINLQKAAREAMLLFAGQSTAGRVLGAIEGLRRTGDAELTAEADELELKLVPKLLVQPMQRSKLSDAAIKRYVDSVEPRKTTPGSSEDGVRKSTATKIAKTITSVPKVAPKRKTAKQSTLEISITE